MKKSLYIFGVLGLITLGGFYIRHKFYAQAHSIGEKNKQVLPSIDTIELQNGDVIFQTSLSEQSKAIQLATHSKYSHCGLIFKEGSHYFVLEAVQPVKKTALAEWISKGEGQHYIIKRLKNSREVLTTSALSKMKQVGQPFIGKNYDLTFEWSNDKMYCSELVWKIYQQATGIEIGKLQKLGDFDLTHPIVTKKMKERYGNTIPKEELVISPKAIFESELLELVKEE